MAQTFNCWKWAPGITADQVCAWRNPHNAHFDCFLFYPQVSCAPVRIGHPWVSWPNVWQCIPGWRHAHQCVLTHLYLSNLPTHWRGRQHRCQFMVSLSCLIFLILFSRVGHLSISFFYSQQHFFQHNKLFFSSIIFYMYGCSLRRKSISSQFRHKCHSDSCHTGGLVL